MKSGSQAATLLGHTPSVSPAAPPRESPESLTSMEKRRWLCRRYCRPGDSCPGSSPLSAGEKVLDSGWGSLPRGPSCRSERERRQLPAPATSVHPRQGRGGGGRTPHPPSAGCAAG